MTDQSFLQLEAGSSSLTLCPEAGGALVDWRYRNKQLLRPISDVALASRNARQLGCFSLIPYSNRIARAAFDLDGAHYALTPDPKGEVHAIHGNGWYTPWQVAKKTSSEVTLTLDHRPEGVAGKDWPFAYLASQHIRLEDDRLVIGLRIENKDSRRMPAGFGIHPYFHRAADTTFTFAAQTVWTNGADRLPAENLAVPPEWTFTTPRTPDSAVLDNCFADWDQKAHVSWPDYGLTLDMTASPVFSHLVVYTPAKAAFFCVEPVSNMNNAVNRPKNDRTGLVILAPGAVLEGEIRLQLSQSS